MTDIELQAVREHVYQTWDYFPRNETWRAIELKNDIDRVLAYVRRLEKQVNEAQDAAFYRRKRWDD